MCGEASTEALRTPASHTTATSKGGSLARCGRLIAVCYAKDVNLNEELVRQGWAFAYRRYSEEFIEAEDEARDVQRGLWAGEVEAPWLWRRRK